MHKLLDVGKTQAEEAELFGVSANTIGRKVREKMNTKTIVKHKKIRVHVNGKFCISKS